MINKLAVFYKVSDFGTKQLEDALIEIAPQIQRRISSAPSPRVGIMTLVDGAANTTPHVTSMGYTPTGLRAFVELAMRRRHFGD
jgi:hypothetical protein